MDLVFKSKKGIFYSIIAITLLLSLIYASEVSFQFTYREQSSIIETRVNTMDNFVEDLGDDLEKGIHVAAFRAIVGMTNYVINSVGYIDDAEQRIEELFQYGTIYGNASFVMENNSFTDWTVKMQDQGEKIGINIDFQVDSLSMHHDTPWTIATEINVTATVTDIRAFAKWRRTYSVTSAIPIDGFEDPAYIVQTGSGVLSKINRTIYDGIYTSGNNTNNLQYHMNFSLYTENNLSPSFLMRFEGDFNASPFGIESLINKYDVGPYFACPSGTSVVDSIYWGCRNFTTWDVNNMPTWFYLDNASAGGQGRVEQYEVTNLI